MKKIGRRFKQLSNENKTNLIVQIIFSAIFVIGSILTLFGAFINISDRQLISIIVFALGIVCIENVIERFFILFDLKINLNDIMKRTFLPPPPNTITLTTRSEVEKVLPLSVRYSNAKEVDMFSYANSSLFQQIYRDEMKKCIEENKTVFRFVGNSSSVSEEHIKELKENGMLNHGTSNPMASTLESYLDFITRNGYRTDQIEYKTFDMDFPYGMTIVRKHDGSFTVKVDLYTFKTSNNERRCMFLSSENESDKELVEFYLSQWSIVWKQADSYPPVC